MSATAIIGRVRAAGGEITLAGEGIKLKVPASLRDEAVAEIKANKDAIRRALKSEAGDAWDADDYRAFYEERAAIAEYDGGQMRAEAEAVAYECLVVEWLNQHPEPSDATKCAWCGAPDRKCSSIIPFGMRAHVHTWLHPECWQGWHQQRRKDALAALDAAVVRAPTKPDDDPQ